MILVIDDEVDVCELMADYLATSGYEVQKAHSVPEALKLIKENHFELVVCDLVLGTGKGESVLSYLRLKGSGHEGVPCLLVSGKKSEEDLSLGELESFLSKPFSDSEFKAAFLQLKEKCSSGESGEKTKKLKMHPEMKKLLGN